MSQRTRIVFYLVCFFGWLAVGVFPAYRAFSIEDARVEKAFFEKVPLMTPEAIDAEHQSIIASAAGERPELYFDALNRIGELQIAVRKGDYATHGAQAVKYRVLWGVSPGRLQEKYQQKFGPNVMSNASKAWEEAHHRGPLSQYVEGANEGPFWRWAYIAGLPFALIFFLVRLDALGHSLIVELFAPWKLALALLSFPIGIFKYPSGKPARQVVNALRFATFILGTSLSGFAGMAVAQTTSPTKEKKKDDPHTLQIDLRSSDPVGKGVPDIFGRATLITPKGFFLETIDIIRPDRWSISLVAGPRIVKTKKVAAYTVGGLSHNSLGVTTLLSGGQLFYNTPRVGVLLPLMYYEHRIDRRVESVAIGGFAVMKTKRWRVGTDFTFRKIFAGKPQWSIGPLIAHNVGNGFIEAAMLHNSQGEWRLRGRFTHTFAW